MISSIAVCTVIMEVVLGMNGVSDRKAHYIAKYTCMYSKKYNITPITALAVMKVETRWRHLTKPNKTHDYGIMQLHCMPGTKDYKCTRCNVKKLKCNIREGIRWLAHLKAKWWDDEKPMEWLRHYNYGSKKHYRRLRRAINKLKYQAVYVLTR